MSVEYGMDGELKMQIGVLRNSAVEWTVEPKSRSTKSSKSELAVCVIYTKEKI